MSLLTLSKSTPIPHTPLTNSPSKSLVYIEIVTKQTTSIIHYPEWHPPLKIIMIPTRLFRIFQFNLKTLISKIQLELTRSHQPKFDWEALQMALVSHSCTRLNWAPAGQGFEEVQIPSQKSPNHLDPVVVERRQCTYLKSALLQQL